MNVRERLYSVVDDITKSPERGPNERLTVAEVARRANVSRALIYRSYPDVVERIKRQGGGTVGREAQSATLKTRLLRDQLCAERQLTQQLSRACAQLQAEIEEIRARMNEMAIARDLRISWLEKQLDGSRSVVPIESGRR